MRFTNLLAAGQGVTLGPRLTMTALHGRFEIGTTFQIVPFENDDVSSAPESRVGTVFKSYFELNNVDIALIQLTDESAPFDEWLPI